jgi:hypothetical protein
LELESSWWGNEKIGEWVESLWALVDFATDDAYHAAVVSTDDSYLEVHRPGRHHDDVWFPKAKTEVIAEPDWQTFGAESDPADGEILAAFEKRTQYGTKVCLWGDTYDALSDDGDALLDDLWDDLHPAYDGFCWGIDEIDGRVMGRLTEGGYDVKVLPSLL